MCGIVGYVGKNLCAQALLDGLERLEYRGYDSAGIAIYNNHAVHICKTKGRLANLRDEWQKNPIDGVVGIGHTRWATHGEPNQVNAHPHMSQNGEIAIVHNGIIENHAALKKEMVKQDVSFSSQTDSEVVVQMLERSDGVDIKQKLLSILPKLDGSYALAVVAKNEPGVIYCARLNSPLVIGQTNEAFYIASDIPAILPYSRDVYQLTDGEVARMTANSLEIWNLSGEEITRESVHIDWDEQSAEKGGFDHYMLKEIMEQPDVLKKTFEHYVVNLDGEYTFREGNMPENLTMWKQVTRIQMIGCGTAYHAGIVAKSIWEKIAKVPVYAEVASEYRYQDSPILENEIAVVISQSGETADSLAAIKKLRQEGVPCLAICNVMGSSIAREADAVLYTLAGPEIAVASTKAYTCQLMLLTMIGIYIAEKRGAISSEERSSLLKSLMNLPDKVTTMLTQESQKNIQSMVSIWDKSKEVFFLGRGLDYASAQEGALKLKEIAYVHSEAHAAGELKHGTIALIEDGTAVIALATQKKVQEKMYSNVAEVCARGADVLLIVPENAAVPEGARCWTLPQSEEIFYPLLSIIPLQLFAYGMSEIRGCDVDKPRNLAKSVTVE